MSNYPARYESDTLLRDGSTLRLRPIRPDDVGALMEFHKRLSPRSVYFRYFSPLPELSHDKAVQLCAVDYHDTFALVGEHAGRIVAVARYYRDQEVHDRGEVAFLTEDALQGRGIATRMLERLAVIARENRIRTFEAYVLGDNRKMIDVFLNTGFQVERRLDGGVFYITFSITPTPELEEKLARPILVGRPAVAFVRTVTAKDGNVRTLRLESKYVPSRNVTLVGTGGKPVEQPARPNPANGDGA